MCLVGIILLVVFGVSSGVNYVLPVTQSYVRAILFVLAQPLAGLVLEGIIHTSNRKTQIVLRASTKIFGVAGIIAYLFGFIMGFVILDDSFPFEAISFFGQCALEICGISILIHMIVGFIECDAQPTTNPYYDFLKSEAGLKKAEISRLEQEIIKREAAVFRHNLRRASDSEIRREMGQ